MPSFRREGLFHEKYSDGGLSAEQVPKLVLGEGVGEEVAVLDLSVSS